MKEELELWMRNPVECAAKLLSNPAFKENMVFASQRSEDETGRIYHEIWTADWWAETEVRPLALQLSYSGSNCNTCLPGTPSSWWNTSPNHDFV
jgi:hypothetical protein